MSSAVDRSLNCWFLTHSRHYYSDKSSRELIVARCSHEIQNRCEQFQNRTRANKFGMSKNALLLLLLLLLLEIRNSQLYFLVRVYSPLGDCRRTHKPHKCFVEKFVYWHTGEYRWVTSRPNTRPKSNTGVRCPVQKNQQRRSQLKEALETYFPIVCKRTGPGENCRRSKFILGNASISLLPPLSEWKVVLIFMKLSRNPRGGGDCYI